MVCFFSSERLNKNKSIYRANWLFFLTGSKCFRVTELEETFQEKFEKKKKMLDLTMTLSLKIKNWKSPKSDGWTFGSSSHFPKILTLVMKQTEWFSNVSKSHKLLTVPVSYYFQTDLMLKRKEASVGGAVRFIFFNLIIPFHGNLIFTRIGLHLLQLIYVSLSF